MDWHIQLRLFIHDNLQGFCQLIEMPANDSSNVKLIETLKPWRNIFNHMNVKFIHKYAVQMKTLLFCAFLTRPSSENKKAVD